ncbi:MAG: hypothetical protein RIT45_465 [Pseudomonadota bacterium]|jgi:hypothetical protein
MNVRSDPRRPFRFGVLLLVVLSSVALFATGCGKGTSIGAAPAGSTTTDEPEQDTLSSKQILQKGGLCDLDEVVDDPDPDSDEWVIYRLYQLSLAENTEENFQSFRELFPSQRNARQIREMYWPRIRRNVSKYMNEPGEPAYTICRKMKTDDGMKYFIKTTDPRQHPPPITVGEADGKKKVLAFTPF